DRSRAGEWHLLGTSSLTHNPYEEKAAAR
ncbi:hypothetical protein AVEN_191664-1, partial [Araneus ventricosus]